MQTGIKLLLCLIFYSNFNTINKTGISANCLKKYTRKEKHSKGYVDQQKSAQTGRSLFSGKKNILGLKYMGSTIAFIRRDARFRNVECSFAAGLKFNKTVLLCKNEFNKKVYFCLCPLLHHKILSTNITHKHFYKYLEVKKIYFHWSIS